MVQSSTQDRQIVYGRRCVGSIQDYIFTSGDNNKYLNYIMLLGDGPFESVDELWLENRKGGERKHLLRLYSTDPNAQE